MEPSEDVLDAMKWVNEVFTLVNEGGRLLLTLLAIAALLWWAQIHQIELFRLLRVI